MGDHLTLSYYPWITQSIAGATLAQAVTSFRDVLQTELQKIVGAPISIQLLPAMEIPDQITDITATPTGAVSGKIALMNPIGYALTHESVPAVESIIVVRRKIGTAPAGPHYKSQIYTNVLSGISSLSDLHKRSFAFGSPQSTSNFLVPAFVLWKAGFHPANAFSRLDFAGGHPEAAIAVYDNQIDAGAVTMA